METPILCPNFLASSRERAYTLPASSAFCATLPPLEDKKVSCILAAIGFESFIMVYAFSRPTASRAVASSIFSAVCPIFRTEASFLDNTLPPAIPKALRTPPDTPAIKAAPAILSSSALALLAACCCIAPYIPMFKAVFAIFPFVPSCLTAAEAAESIAFTFLMTPPVALIIFMACTAFSSGNTFRGSKTAPRTVPILCAPNEL